MNNFLVYINGLLMVPEMFVIKLGNNARIGRFAEASIDTEKLDEDVKTLDVFEVRAGSLVRRYHYDEPSEDDKVVTEATDDKPSVTRFRCRSVVNAF